MAEERPVVNVTPGNTIKSSAELEAAAVKSNTGDEERLGGHPPKGASSVGDEELTRLADPRGDRFSHIAMSREEIEAREKIDELMALPPEQRTARMAMVLDRGIIADRLKVDCPADLHYEWVRNDPMEIDRMRTLGFWVDNTYATRRALHSDGSSANQVGDVICVMTTAENKKMIDQIYLEKQLKATRNPKKAQEDEEFASMTEKMTDGIIPTFSESSQRMVTAADVRAALQRANAQTEVKR